MLWVGKQVLVTGAGGFIGSHLVERLGARVCSLVHYNSRNDWGLLELLPQAVKKEIDVIPGDITDPFGVSRALDSGGIASLLDTLLKQRKFSVTPSIILR